MARLLALIALLLAIPAHAAVNIEWVTVGDRGNACDPAPPGWEGCHGGVAYTYRVSKYEVTTAQYVEFLNAIAADDTYRLYAPPMGGAQTYYYGGITRSGSEGSYSYSAIAGREDMPVNWVAFSDAQRFVNWLHNGQPTGAQDDTTTEDGAYTMTAQGIGDNTITRNAGARIFLPTEDEWYKAAFYDGSSDSYFDYPAGSDAQTMCALPGAAANTANCNSAVGDFTNVGSYPGSASPYGTLDQGGNTQEWNETIFHELDRGIRGGSFFASPDDLTAAPYVTSSPTGEVATKGFRLASPVPAVPSLSPVGLLLVAAGLLGFGVYRRSRE